MAHVVVFAGEYDLNTKRELREKLSHLYSTPDVVLDMSKVRFIDSTFISELLMLVKSRREKTLSRVTIVTQANSMVRRLFEVTGIMPLFNVVESYSSAIDDSGRVTYAAFGRSRETVPV